MYGLRYKIYFFFPPKKQQAVPVPVTDKKSSSPLTGNDSYGPNQMSMYISLNLRFLSVLKLYSTESTKIFCENKSTIGFNSKNFFFKEHQMVKKKSWLGKCDEKKKP